MRAALVIFLGGFGGSPAERLVDGARLSATLDSAAAWEDASGSASRTIVVTDDAGIINRADIPPGVIIDADPGPFHFGRRLAGVVRRHGPEAVVCMGGGSLPFFGPAEFAGFARRVAAGLAVTNNAYSSDIVGFPLSERALDVVEVCSRDNSLARALQEQAGLGLDELPRTVASQFDIDAPSDVAILALAVSCETGPRTGPRLAAYLASRDIDLSRYRAALPLFPDRSKQLLIAGRVGSHAWGYLERETACRVRLFAEERGMEADGRAEAGTARSLLGYHLEAVGPHRFFETLGELGDAAFIDSRVILAHGRIAASREDRFRSDLGQWQEVGDTFLREFTRAAAEAPIPVVLGGHSLMSGGLMALNELAWALRDGGGL